MALRKPYRNIRVAGGGYTFFRWEWPGEGPIVLGFANSATVTSPNPVADAQAIQPLNEQRPIEIITTRAIGHWEIVLEEFEKWNAQAWHELAGIAESVDLAEIFDAVANQENPIKVHQVVKPPLPGGAPYYKTYHGCVVANARDDETVNVQSMQVLKNITIWATHVSISRGADVAGSNQ